MTARPLVSVIVPAWNAQATIEESLRSAAGQSYRDIEILVVDDGSTDRTAAIVERFCETEPRARLIRKENGGVASARNRAIAEATGEWIAPLDADDLWHPSKIEKEVAAAQSPPQRPGFVYSWRRIIDEQGRVVATCAGRSIRGFAFNRLSYFNPVACGSAILADRDAILQAGGYDEGLRAQAAQGYEDWMLQLAIARDRPVECVPEHLVGWRAHGRNMSSDFEQMDRSRNLMFRRIAEAGAPVPDWVTRKVAARDAFEIFQQAAVRKSYGSAGGWLARSIGLDPIGSGLMLAYRLVRSARRRLGAPQAPAAPLHFLEVDPASNEGSDPQAIGWFARTLSALDDRRLKQLARLDSRSAATGSE
jgi:glycosyltransferase involved in cell wall biosynthesis